MTQDRQRILAALTVLGLGRDATHEQVRIAHRDLVQVWHPDRFLHNTRLQKTAQNKLVEINEAYEILELWFCMQNSRANGGTNSGPDLGQATATPSSSPVAGLSHIDKRSVLRLGLAMVFLIPGLVVASFLVHNILQYPVLNAELTAMALFPKKITTLVDGHGNPVTDAGRIDSSHFRLLIGDDGQPVRHTQTGAVFVTDLKNEEAIKAKVEEVRREFPRGQLLIYFLMFLIVLLAWKWIGGWRRLSKNNKFYVYLSDFGYGLLFVQIGILIGIQEWTLLLVLAAGLYAGHYWLINARD